jgi:pyruvate dehydrogenase E1 component alpha subunit
MHFFSKEKGLLGGHGIVGGQIPVGTGAAFTAKYLQTGGVSITFLGDGASPQGSFHESLNMAALWNLPAIYCIENNLYGMGTATQRAVAVKDIAESKAPGYAMKAYTVDGLNPYACWKLGQEAVAEARQGKPILIEFKTYRYRGHSVSDAGSYRSKEEVACYQSNDPIDRIRRDLVEAKWATLADLEALDERIQERVRAACQFAEESAEPPMSELAAHVYAE